MARLCWYRSVLGVQYLWNTTYHAFRTERISYSILVMSNKGRSDYKRVAERIIGSMVGVMITSNRFYKSDFKAGIGTRLVR